jgi:hypothetical protein
VIPNKLIRKVGYQIQSNKSNTKHLNLNETNIKEYILCRTKPLYYIQKYVKFETTGGISDYTNDRFHSKLKRYIRSAHLYHNSLLMASRQLGKSTISGGLLDWAMRFYPRNRAVILNFKKESAIENLKKIKFINDYLPDFLQLDFASKSDIKTYVTYGNGSEVKTFYPTTIHTKDTLARSLTAPILYIDEAAFITDMREVFGSAQPILSTARKQAKSNNYPYFIIVTSTPNGTAGSGSWFFDRVTNAIDTDLLFDENEKWVENKETLIADPSKNAFLKTRYHWSEDPTKDEKWYIEQCRELSDQRKVNQELDLVFVGTSNCIFEDDLLSEFDGKKSKTLLACPHGTNLTIYKTDLNKDDFYLIGVDTARSLTGAFNSIEVFSFTDFEQIAEFNYRLGSFNKYGEIIDHIFRWLARQIGENIILAIENNTIGLAPLEYLLEVKDINYQNFIYKDPVKKNPGQKNNNKEEWGISTTGISKDLMIGCLVEILKEDPKVIKSQELINQLSGIERTRGGSISSESFSDLFMATCFAAYARKMRAMEIMPLITMGRKKFTQQKFNTFKDFIDINVGDNTPDNPESISPYINAEAEIDQLIRTHDQREDISEYFSPFV